MLEILSIEQKSEKLNQILHRTVLPTAQIEKRVEEILSEVKENGDGAIRKYSFMFDEVDLETFEVSEEEISQALNEINDELMEALLAAKENIERYHEKQLQTGYKIENEISSIQQIINPIERVGIYIPGGKAAYP